MDCENPSFYLDILNAQGDESIKDNMLKSRREIINNTFDAFKNHKWDEALSAFPRRTRLLLFIYIKDFLDDKKYYELLGEILSDVYMYDYFDEFLYLINNARDWKYRKYIMTPKERKILEEFPVCDIYRGCSEDNKNGYSWTTDIKQAEFFANRNKGKVLILQGQFEKANVIAWFNRESEIFINPCDVKNISVLKSYNNRKAATNALQRNNHIRIKNYTLQDSRYVKFLYEEVRYQIPDAGKATE